MPPLSGHDALRCSPATARCYVIKGAASALQGESVYYVTLRDDVLLLGKWPMQFEDLRLLSGAVVERCEDIVSVAPPFNISKELSLRFSSAGEAEVWSRKLEHASKLWQTSMCISSRGFPSGSSKELTAAQETLSSLETLEGVSSSQWTHDGAPLSGTSDEVMESDDDSIDSWVEAQIERSSQLLAMFQQQEKWLGSTEDCVARQLQALEGDLFEALLKEEALQAATIEELQDQVQKLAEKYRQTQEPLPDWALLGAATQGHSWKLQDLAKKVQATVGSVKTTAVARHRMGPPVVGALSQTARAAYASRGSGCSRPTCRATLPPRTEGSWSLARIQRDVGRWNEMRLSQDEEMVSKQIHRGTSRLAELMGAKRFMRVW